MAENVTDHLQRGASSQQTDRSRMTKCVRALSTQGGDVRRAETSIGHPSNAGSVLEWPIRRLRKQKYFAVDTLGPGMPQVIEYSFAWHAQQRQHGMSPSLGMAYLNGVSLPIDVFQP
jgi:hypothetical protein